MNLQQARISLGSIANARRKAGQIRNYRDSASLISIWGIVWFVGFGTQQFLPDAAFVIWCLGWVGALTWTFTRPRKPYDWQAFATWFLAIAFIMLVLVVVRADQRVSAMIFSLTLSVSYAILGIWAGLRFFTLAGIVLAAACAGWWLFPQWLYSFLAVGGGGALLIGGVWFRKP